MPATGGTGDRAQPRNRPFTTRAAVFGSAPISFGPNRTVAPGQSVTIDVFFTCESQTSFEARATVFTPTDEDDDGAEINTIFTIRGTIVRVDP